MFIADNSAFFLSERIERSFAVHLWNEMWRIQKMDKDKQYPPSCLYETLKKKYLKDCTRPAPELNL
ncbi:MAG: hypothetical protein D3909_10150 [Candidatus Electrothrix sp. ATG1]|nr:hypothetical protein [Candidatus Electrothrix sp. ATG1]